MQASSPLLRLVDHPELDEFEAALLVAEALAPGFDEATTRADADALASAFADRPDPSGASLCAYMREQGFVGAADDYYGLDHSCIDQVLKRRSGIPISLAVLYLKVAREAGLAGVGVNFPGHFLIDVAGELIDPYRGETTDRGTCAGWLREAGYSGPLDAAFRPTRSRDVALRMLTNARGVLTAQRQWADALSVLDHQRALAPEDVQLEFDRAQLWLGSGAPQMARSVLEEARARFTDPTIRAEIDRGLSGLPASGTGPVLN